MGKGDLRTRRGKIHRGTFGKKRSKPAAVRKKRKASRQQPARSGEAEA